MDRKLLVSGLSVAAGSALVACGGGTIAALPGAASGRKAGVLVREQPDDSGTPNPIDSGSGLKIIGSVTARRYPSNPITDAMSFDWDVSQFGWRMGTLRYLGAVWKLDKSLLRCTADNGLLVASTAQAVATYLQSNGTQLATVTQDLIIYAQVYLAGGATALEFLGAAAAVMSVADWAAMLATLGITAATVYVVMRCGVDSY